MRHSFVRFLLVGILNTLIGLSTIYTFLHIVGLSYWPSTFLGNSIGACVSYFLNRSFTFKSNNTHGRSIVRFVLVIGVCYFLAYYLGMKIIRVGMSWMQVEGNSLAKDLSVLMGMGLYTILNYLGQRFFVFSKQSVDTHAIMEDG